MNTNFKVIHFLDNDADGEVLVSKKSANLKICDRQLNMVSNWDLNVPEREMSGLIYSNSLTGI